LLAEAMVALLAIDFCREIGFSKIVSESDSLLVIKGICDPGSLLVRIGIMWRLLDRKLIGFLLVIGFIVVEKLMMLPMF
jgi:hypothetical protein